MILFIVDRSHYTIDVLLSLFIAVFCWVWASSLFLLSISFSLFPNLLLIFSLFLFLFAEILPHSLAPTIEQPISICAVDGGCSSGRSRRREGYGGGDEGRDLADHCSKRGPGLVVGLLARPQQVQGTQRGEQRTRLIISYVTPLHFPSISPSPPLPLSPSPPLLILL